MTAPVPSAKRIVLVLGDQLNLDSAAFDDFDPAHDLVLMAEVWAESTHVWSAKQRTALFLSAMRHFAQALRGVGRTVLYLDLDATRAQRLNGLGDVLQWVAQQAGASQVSMVQPGDWRVQQELLASCQATGLALQLLEDRHFLCSLDEFKAFATGRSRLVMEHFYRQMRRRHGYLMEGEQPVGGQWNFDEDNRKSFGRAGPGKLPSPRLFKPDAMTREVIDLIERVQGTHPGELDSFGWPVTREQALEALRDFVDHRLALFGHYEDAMWAGEPWLYHSRLSAALNLKLLDPREVLDAAQAAYAQDRAPLQAVEGFIRQILGWREYVRGIYWLRMPQMLKDNALEAKEPLPLFFWDANTDMACLRQALGQTLEHGYAHHIQRLMVIGLYALLLGIDPAAVHEWYLAVYVDAVEWAEAPNTLAMSQYADGGVLGTKPYIASGKYIDKMSNYCDGCVYRPEQSTGAQACPITTLYWEFLLRHAERFASNPRMALQVKNAQRLPEDHKKVIWLQAEQHRVGVRSSAQRLSLPTQQDSLF